MSDTIFLIHEDGELVELAASVDPNEAMSQSLLARYPNLLAGGQIWPFLVGFILGRELRR